MITFRDQLLHGPMTVIDFVQHAMDRHYLPLTIFVAAFFLLPGRTFAQTDTPDNKISVQLQSVTHGEACGGGLPRASASSEDQSNFLYGRNRLIVGYERSALEIHTVFQNTAIWGMKGNQGVNLYEGWVKLRSRHGLFAQAGRVALSYDDERIIGTNDFATAAYSHDVLRLGYEGHGHKLHAILAYNQNADNMYSGTYYDGGAQYYKSMQTVWYHYDMPKFPLGASLLLMNIGQQAGLPDNENDPARIEYQRMMGGYLKYHPKVLTFEASYYRQTGKVVDEYKEVMPIEAWMASAKATVKPGDRWGFELGYDYLSGDDYVPVIYGGQFGLPRHEVERGFSPMYGSRNKFYGIMDYFYASAYTNGFTPGLQNAFIGAFGKPFSSLTCGITYHYLAVATHLEDLERTLGHSVELKLSYAISKDITLSAGYTQMSGTDTMARLKKEGDSPQARWGWFSLAISPSLFSSKW